MLYLYHFAAFKDSLKQHSYFSGKILGNIFIRNAASV